MIVSMTQSRSLYWYCSDLAWVSSSTMRPEGVNREGKDDGLNPASTGLMLFRRQAILVALG